MQLDESLLQAMRGDAADGRHAVFLLVDHAGAPGFMNELRARPSIPWCNLFEGSREQGALEVAPLLVHLKNGCTTVRELQLLGWVLDAAKLSTSLTVLHSRRELVALARALKLRLDASLPDDLPVMLRCFDTRVIESLARVLDAAQRKAFFGIASRWQWLDRAGQLRQVDVEESPTDVWPANFAFDRQQEDALIDASMGDLLVEQMQNVAADLCRGHAPGELHALAQRCLTAAARLDISDIPTQTLYCLTELQLGSGFDLRPEWAPLLVKVKNKELRFEDIFRELGV